jgi:hypothetical protein
MNFLLQGLDNNEETYINMTFFRKDTTAKLRARAVWFPCLGTTVMGFVYEEVAIPAPQITP